MSHGDPRPEDPADDAAMAALYRQLDDHDLSTDPPFDAEAGLQQLTERMGREFGPEPAPLVQRSEGQRDEAAGNDRLPAGQPLPVLGIDLGTAYCRVAGFDAGTGRPVATRDAAGLNLTPSAVYFESAQHAIVGSTAAAMAPLFPELVAQRVKRNMGTTMAYEFHGQRHTPETVSALILRELARAAGEDTGQVARDAVITVPACFGVAEREATRRAGELAGLNVVDLLAEPVAAALSYQAGDGRHPGARHILVYALGAGTFDATVIRLHGDDLAVVCTDGDPKLGGVDWDDAVTSYLVEQLTAEYPGTHPEDDASFMQKLSKIAEDLKKALTRAPSQRRAIRYHGAVTHVELTRDTLDQLTAHLLDQTVTMTQRAIETARGKGVTGFDDVLLVGGMTRMPAVRDALAGRLGLATGILSDPDLAVAKGAALYALVRVSQRPEAAAVASSLPVPEVAAIARKRVDAVVPRGLGVSALDGRDPLATTDPARARKMITHLLPANTALPADSGPFTFHTVEPDQQMITIDVWEQAGMTESDDEADNRLIGHGVLKNLPPLPEGSPVEVAFLMSETGRLTVQATEQQSGVSLKLELQIGDFGPAELDTARRSVAGYDVSG